MAGALPDKDVLRPKGWRLVSAAAAGAGNVPNPACAAVHAAIRNPPLSGSTAKASTPTSPSATRLRQA